MRRDSRVFVSPPSLTDRHNCTLGGSLSRSTWLQVTSRVDHLFRAANCPRNQHQCLWLRSRSPVRRASYSLVGSRNRSVVVSGGCLPCDAEQVREEQYQPGGGGKKGHHGDGQPDGAGVRGDEHGQSRQDADETG